MAVKVLVDIGSTYTKATAVDLDRAALLATERSATTAQTGVTLGLRDVLEKVERALGVALRRDDVTACSSAAGGLRMVSVGLVPELTAEGPAERRRRHSPAGSSGRSPAFA